jgi:trimeric autotransporter adhesin
MKPKRLFPLILSAGVFVLISGCGGSGSGSGGNNTPTPAISSISPTSLSAGSSSQTITVTGSGFISASVIEVGGVAEVTTYVSSTELTATVPATQLASGAQLTVVVTNGSTTSSSGTPVNLAVNNPSPTIASVTPAIELVGATNSVVAVTGTGFVSTTVINVNGSARQTSYVSSTQITGILTATDLATAGSVSITAVNPTPGGGSSAASSIAVNNPLPGPITLSPNQVPTGVATPNTITVVGTNFVPSSTVRVGGMLRTTTYVSATQLTFQLAAADQVTTGTLSVVVVNPSPGGGTSTPANLVVASPSATPVISSLSPNPIFAGSTATTLSVLGTGLTNDSTVQWNGTALTTVLSNCYINYIYGPCLQATIPASLLVSAGTANVTVSSPTATPSVSNTVVLTITNPPVPSLSSLSVTYGTYRSAISIGIVGAGFTSASTVLFNGSPVPTTFVSSNALTANVPASSLAAPGVFPVTINTSAPGGGTSSALYFTSFVSIPNNSMAYNPANGLFYLSVPSAAGAPYGDTIVPIDPVTGTLGTPIPVGSEPDRLAITADGKYLWVALDSTGAVRQVDLTTGTAGMQFPIGPTGSSTNTVAALAALPGSPNSVVVSTYFGGLSIYDSGVARPSSVSPSTYVVFPWALIVNGTTNEIYGPGSGIPDQYDTYSYDATGVSIKSSTYSSLSYAANNTDDVQIAGNLLYTDYGQTVNPETGALVGTFYSSGTNVAQGAITVDTAQGMAFILEGSGAAFGAGGFGVSSAVLQAFNTADYSSTSAPPIPVTIPIFRASYQYQGPTSSRLTRWGTDGLAYRGTGGFVSLRSNLVHDESSVDADISVALTAPASASTGATTSFTATVTNNGSAAASSVSLAASGPSSGVLVSAVPSAGSCSTGSPTVCDLGGLANGATANVVFNVLQNTAGNSSLTVQANASETDPSPSNNTAVASTAVTGGDYNLSPTLTAISPATIVSGSPDTTITLTGTSFSSSSTVLLNGETLSTSFVSTTQLTATVPAANLATLGWSTITVSNPLPGGGASAALPLTVFSVLPVNAEHILFDPYSRKIMVGLATGTTTLAGNSIAALTPETATMGTPVAIGATPASLALTSDGQFLYALLPAATTGSIAQFNMLTQHLDFTISGFEATGYNTGLRDIAAQPSADNTIAVDQGEYIGTSIFDINPQTKTATSRGAATGIYSGTCPAFLNPSQLILQDLYTSDGAVDIYSVTSNGLVNGSYPYDTSDNLQQFNCFKVDGNLIFGQSGGVASLASTPPAQIGTFMGMPYVTNYAVGIKDFAPDASLGLSFYLTSSETYAYSAVFDSITTFNINTFMPTSVLTLPFSTVEGNTDFTGVDMVRWGQDGLAILSSGGNIYLVRGPAVVPQLLSTSSAATLTSSSATTITLGTGNTLLTLTGTNFLPGVAVTWNGSYRTTTVFSPTQVTVAIPASDLASAGTAALVATNPGAPSSSSITVTIQ